MAHEGGLFDTEPNWSWCHKANLQVRAVSYMNGSMCSSIVVRACISMMVTRLFIVSEPCKHDLV